MKFLKLKMMKFTTFEIISSSITKKKNYGKAQIQILPCKNTIFQKKKPLKQNENKKPFKILL
jgi:hypothetical protein